MNLWPVEHFFHHFGVPLVLEKVFNWSEVHSESSNFLQNPYFSTNSFVSLIQKD